MGELELAYSQLFGNPESRAWRPYLWLELQTPHGPYRVQGLLDSGADRTTLSLDMMRRLGYTAGTTVPAEASTVAGPFDVHHAIEPIKANLPGIDETFDITPTFGANSPILWGRFDVFQAFTITFSEARREFGLTRNRAS